MNKHCYYCTVFILPTHTYVWSRCWSHHGHEQTALHTQTNDKTDPPRGRYKNCYCQAVIMCWTQSLCAPMFSPVETGSAHRYSIKLSVLPRLQLFFFCVWSHSRPLAGKTNVCILFASQNALCLSKWRHVESIYLQSDNLFVSMFCYVMGRCWYGWMLPLSASTNLQNHVRMAQGDEIVLYFHLILSWTFSK